MNEENNTIQNITPQPIQNITPINQVNNVIQTPSIEMVPEDNVFATGFPEWDLVPPYTTVRRVIRK